MMTSSPEMCTYTQNIGLTRTKTGADQYGCRRPWMRYVPATYLMFSIERRENNQFSRKVQFIGTNGIEVKGVPLLGACYRIYHIESYGQHNPQYNNTTPHAAVQDLLQRRTRQSYILQLPHMTSPTFLSTGLAWKDIVYPPGIPLHITTFRARHLYPRIF